MLGVMLRPATEADIDAIAAIQAAAYWSNFDLLEPGSHAHPGYYERVVESARADAPTEWSSTTVALADGEIAGICILEIGASLLSGLWVKPGMQGRGIGSLLILEAFERLRRAGHRRIMIEVHPRNAAARLYERHGFRLIEETTRFSRGLGRDLPLWVMERPLL